MDDVTGWIKLSRKILQEQWYLGEKFTKAMCWIDLLLLAEWRKERTFFIRGIEVVVGRGQVAMPLTDISKRWNLAVNTVRARLREMIKDGRVSVKADNVVTRITILNWEKYQGLEMLVDSVSVETPPANVAQSVVPPAQIIEPETEPLIEDVIVEELQTPDIPVLPPAKPKKPEVDCDFVLRLYHDRCPSLPKVLKLSDKRKMKIRVRFEEMRFDYETLQQVFDKAEASSFMRGDNNRGWRADFDWIFNNSTNWLKILEGKYDDRKPITTIRPTNGSIENPGIASIGGGGYTPTTASQRQKLSVLTTLAKIESEQGGYIPTGDGSKE